MNYKKALGILLLIAVGFGTGIYSSRFLNKDVSQAIKKELTNNPQLITDIILANPELFVGAIENAKSVVDLEKQNHELVFLNGKYDPNRPIVVEYFNFGCQVCGDALIAIKNIKSNNQVALKHIHSDKFPGATLLAQFFEALYIENPTLALKYLELVFSKRDKVGLSSVDSLLNEIFKELNLTSKDKEHLITIIKENQIYDKLAVYRKEAQNLGIAATPSFLIKGKVYSGLPPAAELKKIFE